MERHVPRRGGGNSLKPSHNQDFSLIEVFNNLAPWGEKKFISKLKRTYKFHRGVNNILDCHANQTRILSKEYSFVAGDYVRSTARNDVKCHAEDNSPKYSMVNCTLLLKKAAFTLAEVLITLGIIGVVAALTMPALIQQQHKLVVETRLKKFYSVINQAITMSERDNGDKLYWTPSDSDDLWNSYLKKYIKYVKEEDYYYGRPRKVVYFADGSLAVIDVYYATNEDGSIKEKTTGGHFLFFPFAKDFKPTLSEEEFANLYSKKLFSFGFWPNTDGPQWKQHYNKGVEPYKVRWDGDANKLKEKCYDGTELQWCTAVIQYNNWKIPKDYPFRL